MTYSNIAWRREVKLWGVRLKWVVVVEGLAEENPQILNFEPLEDQERHFGTL